MERCAIRDNTSLCDIADYNDIVELINDNRLCPLFVVLLMYPSLFSVSVHYVCTYMYLSLLCYMFNIVLSESSDMYE